MRLASLSCVVVLLGCHFFLFCYLLMFLSSFPFRIIATIWFTFLYIFSILAFPFVYLNAAFRSDIKVFQNYIRDLRKNLKGLFLIPFTDYPFSLNEEIDFLLYGDRKS